MAPEIEIDDSRCRDLFAVPAIADVPWPGTVIAAGEPIMTLFTTGHDVQECEDRLAELEAYLAESVESMKRICSISLAFDSLPGHTIVC